MKQRSLDSLYGDKRLVKQFVEAARKIGKEPTPAHNISYAGLCQVQARCTLSDYYAEYDCGDPNTTSCSYDNLKASGIFDEADLICMSDEALPAYWNLLHNIPHGEIKPRDDSIYCFQHLYGHILRQLIWHFGYSAARRWIDVYQQYLFITHWILPVPQRGQLRGLYERQKFYFVYKDELYKEYQSGNYQINADARITLGPKWYITFGGFDQSEVPMSGSPVRDEGLLDGPPRFFAVEFDRIERDSDRMLYAIGDTQDKMCLNELREKIAAILQDQYVLADLRELCSALGLSRGGDSWQVKRRLTDFSQTPLKVSQQTKRGLQNAFSSGPGYKCNQIEEAERKLRGCEGNVGGILGFFEREINTWKARHQALPQVSASQRTEEHQERE